jgi:hypothetical protein
MAVRYREPPPNPALEKVKEPVPKKYRKPKFEPKHLDFHDEVEHDIMVKHDIPAISICRSCVNADVRAYKEGFSVMYNTIRLLMEELELGTFNGDWQAANAKIRAWMRTRSFENFRLEEKRRAEKR